MYPFVSAPLFCMLHKCIKCRLEYIISLLKKVLQRKLYAKIITDWIWIVNRKITNKLTFLISHIKKI